MTHIQHRKVRYVKCPKCGRILPEPDQVPLYTCGGCDTVLQAKYYRREKEALVPTVTSEDVQSNSNGHTSEVGKSSGSSQRSSGEQSSIPNQESDENAIDSEQNGDGVSACHILLSEQSSELQGNSGEAVVDKKLDQFDSGGKQADQLPIELETKVGGSDEDRFDGIPIEKQDHEQIRKLNNIRKTSTNGESEVLENRKSPEPAAVNEVKLDENDEQEQCEDVVALDKQKEVEHGNSAKEILSTIQSYPTEKLTQFEPVNIAQGSRVSGNERDRLAEEKPIVTAKLSKEYETGTEQKSFMERIREKLASVTISKDVPTSNQVEVRDESEASLGAYANHNASAPSSASERTASNVLQDPEISLLDDFKETSKQKIASIDDSNKTETLEMVEGNAVEKQDDEHIRKLTNTHKTSTVIVSEVLPIDNFDDSNKTGTSEVVDNAAEKQDDEQIIKLNNADESSTGKDLEVFRNRKSGQLAIVNEVKQDENVKQEQCEDIPLEVAQGNSTKEASIPVQSRPTEKSMQSKPVNMAEGSGVSGNSNGKEPKNSTERIRENLASVTISNDGLMSTEVHNGNENSLPVGESNLRNFDDSDFNGSGQYRFTSKAETSTKRSPAYDGSVSSCDGNDDHVPRQPQHLNEGSFSENDAAAGYIGVPSNRTKHGNWRTRAQVKSSSYQLSNENLKANMLEEQESIREIYIPRDHKAARQHRDEHFPPRIPFPRITSDVAFETGSSSSYAHDEGPNHWTHHHRDRYEDQEQWRGKAYGQRGYMEERRFPEGTWRENDFLPPMYYNDERSGEFYQKQRYHEYSGIRRREESRSFSGNIPRPRYSGEVYNGRHQFPDARRWSAQLPPGPLGAPPGAYYRHEPMTYMDHSGETSWDPYDPYHTNPQRFGDFQSYGWGHDPVYLSDDQRHKDRITKRSYMREKQQATKRHLRPLAGGAPFITCHFCFKVLQLPEEFLVPRRKRMHSLKCAACSNVLEFSLGNDSCLAPRLPSNVESVETNPERDVRSALPSHASHSHTNGKDSHQYNSRGAPNREKRKDMSSNSKTAERAVDSSDGDDGASPSDQSRQGAVTWNLPAQSKSPLHRLMGYSSPHELLTDQAVTDEE